MIRLSHMIFYVQDAIAAVEFYEKTFDVRRKFVYEGGAYAELETGAITLAFANYSLADLNLPQGYLKHEPDKPPQSCEICFTSENVQKTYAKALSHGAAEVAPPTQKPWGETVGYIRDPQGILIAIASGIA